MRGNRSTLARLGPIAERRWALVTTAQAESADACGKQLARTASAGAIECVAEGVYRYGTGKIQQRDVLIPPEPTALGG